MNLDAVQIIFDGPGDIRYCGYGSEDVIDSYISGSWYDVNVKVNWANEETEKIIINGNTVVSSPREFCSAQDTDFTGGVNKILIRNNGYNDGETFFIDVPSGAYITPEIPEPVIQNSTIEIEDNKPVDSYNITASIANFSNSNHQVNYTVWNQNDSEVISSQITGFMSSSNDYYFKSEPRDQELKSWKDVINWTVKVVWSDNKTLVGNKTYSESQYIENDDTEVNLELYDPEINQTTLDSGQTVKYNYSLKWLNPYSDTDKGIFTVEFRDLNSSELYANGTGIINANSTEVMNVSGIYSYKLRDYIGPSFLSDDLKISVDLDLVNSNNETYESDRVVLFHYVDPVGNLFEAALLDFLDPLGNLISDVLTAFYKNILEPIINTIISTLENIINVIISTLLFVVNALTYIISTIAALINHILTILLNYSLDIYMADYKTGAVVNESNASLITGISNGYIIKSNQTILEYLDDNNKTFIESVDNLEPVPIATFTFDITGTTLKNLTYGFEANENTVKLFENDTATSNYFFKYDNNTDTLIHESSSSTNINTFYKNTTKLTNDYEYIRIYVDVLEQYDDFGDKPVYFQLLTSPDSQNMVFQDALYNVRVNSSTDFYVEHRYYKINDSYGRFEVYESHTDMTLYNKTHEYTNDGNTRDDVTIGFKSDGSIGFNKLSISNISSSIETDSTIDTTPEKTHSINYYKYPYEYPNGVLIGIITAINVVTIVLAFVIGLIPVWIINSIEAFIKYGKGILKSIVLTLNGIWYLFDLLFIKGFDTTIMIAKYYAIFKAAIYGKKILDADKTPGGMTQAVNEIIDDIKEKYLTVLDVTYKSVELLAHISRTVISFINFLRNLLPI